MNDVMPADMTRTPQSWRARLGPLAKQALFRVGAYAAVRRLAPSRKAAILRYHAICGVEGFAYASPGICVSPEAFEAHVRYLAAHYAVLPLGEIVDRLRQRRPLPANCVAITFDDGYADNLAAARTLERHGLSATFFITSHCLADGAPFWPAELRYLIRTIVTPAVQLQAGGRVLDLPLAGEGDRARAVGRLTKVFKSLPIPERDAIRAQLRSAAGSPASPTPMLRWDQLAEMARIGMTIGAHTMTHPNLPSAGLAAATEEIRGSKARLERELGRPVTLFSYPNGGAETYFTEDLKRVVSESGYAAACSSRNRFADERSDLYALERVQVQERLEDLVFALEVERFAFAPVN